VYPSKTAAVEALFEARAESLEEAADTAASLGMRDLQARRARARKIEPDPGTRI
jgi:hypothetical protein